MPEKLNPFPANSGAAVPCLVDVHQPSLPTVKDVCGNILTPTYNATVDSIPDVSTDGTGTVTFRYHYQDCTGYDTVWTFTDTLKPGSFTPPANDTAYVNCVYQILAGFPLPTITNCGANVDLIPSDTTSTLANGCGDSTFVYSYNVNDRDYTWSYTYRVTPQEFTVPADSVIKVQCISSVKVWEFVPPKVTNSCSDVIVPELQATTDSTFNGCTGTVVYTWKYSDCVGGDHEKSWKLTYLVGDTIKPAFKVPADFSVCRNVDGSFDITDAGEPTNVSDNCKSLSELTISHEDVSTNYGTKTDTIFRTWTVSDGCNDSVKVQRIFVHPLYLVSLKDTLCEGAKYTFNNVQYTARIDTVLYDSVKTLAGCDSVHVLMLKVNHPTTFEIDTIVLQNFMPCVVNDSVYNAPGTYTQHLTNHVGCDSVLTIKLTVLNNVFTEVDSTICKEELPFTWNDSVFTAAGSKMTTLHTATGTDSTVKMNLSLFPYYNDTMDVEICQGTVYDDLSDTVLATAGTYTRKYQSVNGCDSLVTVVLTINPTHRDTITEHLCEGGSLMFNDTLRKTSGWYIYNGFTSKGCDSVVVLHLLVDPIDTTYLNQTICSDELPFSWNGSTFTESDTKFIKLQTVDGCDSVVAMTLTVNPSYNVPASKTICQSELPYTWNGVTFTAAGTQAVTLQTVKGCDSVVTMTLTVTSNTMSVDTVEACDTYTWIDGETYTESTNTPTFTLTNAAGCDSVVTLHLTMYYTENHYDTVNRCGEAYYVWPRSGDTLTQSGDYVYEHHEGNDDDDHDHSICSHMDYLHLSLGDPSETEFDTIHCGPFEWNGIMYDSSGYFTQYLINQNGCDSIVHMLLDVTHEAVVYIYDTIPATGEGSYPIMWRGDTIWHGGFYSDTVITADGLCDSIYNIIFYTKCNYQIDFTSVITPPLCDNNSAAITVSNVQKITETGSHVPLESSIYYFGKNVMGEIIWDSSTVGYYVYDSLSAPGMHVIIVRDDNGCFTSRPTMILPGPSHELICPQPIVDTLLYGSSSYISLEELGTPVYTNWDTGRLVITSIGIPEDNLFPDGLTTIKWIVADTTCGLLDSCEQNVNIVFPECPDAVDCEGNNYSSVRIDNYCWTKINLRSGHYQEADGSCGDTIPCIYEYTSLLHPNTSENVDTFGRLYCFQAAVGDSTINENGHIQGICPAGWYLPSPEQYMQLNAHGGYALKVPYYWTDGGGDNSTGFTWLPAGYWNGAAQRFEGMLSDSYFWSAKVVNGEIHYSAIWLHHDCDSVQEVEAHEGMGFSIRCIKE